MRPHTAGQRQVQAQGLNTVAPAQLTDGDNWPKTHDYLATWLQGVGTFVALVAIIVTLEHYQRGGFRLRVRDVAAM